MTDDIKIIKIYEGTADDIEEAWNKFLEVAGGDESLKGFYTIDEFIMKNLIYCEDVHSFTHKLWDKWKKKMPTSKFDAQQDAWQVVAQMQKERQNARKDS